MNWYERAVFYHIYPLGLSGAPKKNDYGEPVHRLNTLLPWIEHIRNLGCNALYIGPLFESVGHGYETTDYRKVDNRLGTNEDLKNFVAECHRQGIRVILDGVFNHVGRDFFAFQDLQQNRENSLYRDWFCNVNFWGNNEYNDGFSYENWGGYNLLVKLNQKNGDVQNYLCDSIRMWVEEFDIDGLRLDAADVLDFGFMQTLRRLAEEVKPEFWLMGEVIHGDYTRWVNDSTLHSVTDYNLHKALYSGHNDHNYFEIAHTVKHIYDMGLNHAGGRKLYSFTDNHDVERIYTKLQDKGHFIPVHILLYTLPGIPSVYYGSEFGIEGHKEQWSDDSLRPALNLEDFKDALTNNPYTGLIATLGRLRQSLQALYDGDYRELLLTNRQFAFDRTKDDQIVIVAVNNDSNPVDLCIPVDGNRSYIGVLSGQRIMVTDDRLNGTIPGNSGEIWIPEDTDCLTEASAFRDISKMPITNRAEQPSSAAGKADMSAAGKTTAEGGKKTDSTSEKKTTSKGEGEAALENDKKTVAEAEKKDASATDSKNPETKKVPDNRSYEEMTVEELQNAILEKLAQNGPVTDQMRKDVADNIWHDSLVTWVKSFQR